MANHPPSPPQLQPRELPMEIITNILSRIPIKPLHRFKLASKSFLSLISSSHFSKLHLSHSLSSDPTTDRHLIISEFSKSSLSSAPFDLDTNHLTFSELTHHPLKNHPNHDHPHIQFLGTCHGILGISYYKNTIFLYNPLTHSSRSLPPLPNTFSADTSNSFVSGFGYDSTRDDYKVLTILQHNSNNNDSTDPTTSAALYCFTTDKWEAVGPVFTPYVIVSPHCMLVNEALHVLLKKDKTGAILSFDLRTHSFAHLQLPKDYIRKDNSYGFNSLLSELGGCLSLSVNFQLPPENDEVEVEMEMYRSYRGCWNLESTDLWVMKEYGKVESWVKLFSVGNPARLGMDCRVYIAPVEYSKDKEKVLINLDGFSLGWYHLKTGVFERVTTVRTPPNGEPFEVCCVVGSLVSVDRDGEKRSSGGAQNRKKNNKPKEGKQGNVADNFLSKGFKLRL